MGDDNLCRRKEQHRKRHTQHTQPKNGKKKYTHKKSKTYDDNTDDDDNDSGDHEFLKIKSKKLEQAQKTRRHGKQKNRIR